MKQRGIFEKFPGSGVWWIRYADAIGRIRREKAGSKSAALLLYRKRKTEALQGKKLPERLRAPIVSFAELAQDALAYSKAHKRSYPDDVYRMARLLEWFRDRAADSITPQEIERKLEQAIQEEGWAPATCNRHRALLSLIYRLGIRNGKVSANPARLVRHRPENNARMRWLSAEEEKRLREVMQGNYAEHVPELDLALNTGLRLSEMYGLTWENVNLSRRILTVPRSKNGEMRHVPLDCRATVGEVGNSEAELIKIGKAGKSRGLGIRPTVRGTVMNPVDHPYGGGEGKQPRGTKRPKTIWGKVTGGRKTRNKKKWSNKLILQRRPKIR